MTLALAAQRSSNPVARLGSSHGYRLDGDLAHLNAEIICDEARLTGQQWALQLWADSGVKIAELQLGLLHPNGSGSLLVSGSASALPPAGEGPHIVSMTLASGAGSQLDRIEDVASYAQPVSFVQPRLRGTVCSGFTNDQITLDIARIENPRTADNVSGTLALELWALDSPYNGGAWSGIPVASLVLGTLNGQSEWAGSRFTTHAGPLPTTGHLTLMLREWTPAGYVTRDYRMLARPSVTLTKEESGPQASAKAHGQPAAPAKAVKQAEPAAATGVSINTASVAELKAIKGISEGLARAIVAGRPYARLDDVVRAKGMGSKLLAKIRAGLKL
jgi:hypothetical protein